MVLATSGQEFDLEWRQPAIGGEDVVDGATTSADVESAKPAPDLLRTAAADHGLDPGRTVAVGDTVWDVRAAKDAGFPCIALACGGISRAELLEEDADEVYADPADLPAPWTARSSAGSRAAEAGRVRRVGTPRRRGR